MLNQFLSEIQNGEIAFPLVELTLHRGDGQQHVGTGHLVWTQDGCRLHAVTDGGSILQREFGRFPGRPGEIIPENQYLSMNGRTQDGWRFTVERLDRSGYHVHSGRETIVWRIANDGFRSHVTYERERSTGDVASAAYVAIASGLEFGSWPRSTETRVENPAFGNQRQERDWLQFPTSFGDVAVRKVNSDLTMIRVSEVKRSQLTEARAAIQAALSYVDGRRCEIHAFCEYDGGVERRWLSSFMDRQRNQRIHSPLDRAGRVAHCLEPMLGCLCNFFLTEEGQETYKFLDAWMDAMDNRFTSRVMVECSIVEALARQICKNNPTIGISEQPKEVLSAVDRLKDQLHAMDYSASTKERLTSLLGMVRNRSAKDRLFAIQRAGWGGVSVDEISSWSALRNKVMHGDSPIGDGSLPRFQNAVTHSAKIANLINRMVLQSAGYSGSFFDYSTWMPAELPAGDIE
ncbi:hypothetical protein [Rosistilla oblonga]|uniref:ApeA N-terminal domain-containing protein n=1 Tax=Rosistilla oblonga TaxID=2527990 RepID=A0A518J294_9BACT|nr:hypothetical protein [Rosistilla oblonga]QDV59456.1 hypothetical protein Mal33_54910 [Rosistilla oblonga]